VTNVLYVHYFVRVKDVFYYYVRARVRDMFLLYLVLGLGLEICFNCMYVCCW
jgi:hypothetical protein